ncbi:phage tail protein [Pseudomonas sp. NPDC089406]|uniref:phage tail protein n=1 Tax=Pseudomonas sp. NPDC089406 TaxID=3364463 RepID=UPI00384AC7BC
MSEPYVGEIRLFAGNYAPVNWLACDGSILKITDYQALYSLIGTTYGGDGRDTFMLPDLRGRVVVGQGNGTGLTPRTLGQAFGTETVTLAAENTPPHQHPFSVNAAPATSITPADSSNTNTRSFGIFTPVNQMRGLYNKATATTNLVTLNPAAVTTYNHTPTPHNNVMASSVINYIICVNGYYPTQS